MAGSPRDDAGHIVTLALSAQIHRLPSDFVILFQGAGHQERESKHEAR